MIVTLAPVPVFGFWAAARAWIPSERHAALSIQNLDLFLLYSETIQTRRTFFRVDWIAKSRRKVNIKVTPRKSSRSWGLGGRRPPRKAIEWTFRFQANESLYEICFSIEYNVKVLMVVKTSTHLWPETMIILDQKVKFVNPVLGSSLAAPGPVTNVFFGARQKLRHALV